MLLKAHSQAIPTIEVKIRGYHLDVYGHVNNARYLEFLEEARWDLFERHFDIDRWKELRLGFFVARIAIDYRLPASLGDVFLIRTHISRIGERSAVFSQRVFRKESEELLADADITFVLADLKTGRAVPLEGELREAFASFQQA